MDIVQKAKLIEKLQVVSIISGAFCVLVLLIILFWYLSTNSNNSDDGDFGVSKNSEDYTKQVKTAKNAGWAGLGFFLVSAASYSTAYFMARSLYK